MGMDQAQGVGLLEWRGAGRQGVQEGAKRVEVGAVIHRSIHPPGLFGPLQDAPLVGPY